MAVMATMKEGKLEPHQILININHYLDDDGKICQKFNLVFHNSSLEVVETIGEDDQVIRLINRIAGFPPIVANPEDFTNGEINSLFNALKRVFESKAVQMFNATEVKKQ